MNQDQQVLLILSSRNRRWEFPKGRLQSGESDETAALRETIEETGITELALIPGFDEEIFFRFSVEEGGVIDKSVRYFAFRTTTSDIKLDDKHSDYRWCSKEEALELLYHENYQRLIRGLYELL